MSIALQQNAAAEVAADHGAYNPQIPPNNPVPLEGHWKPMLESNCMFDPDMFLRVMHNLIKNPNIMSSHLFRADIFYDSETDHTIIEGPGTDDDFSNFTRHLKQAYRPRYSHLPGYKWQQTYVRQLIPRNRQLDKDLVQSCHFYVQRQGPKTKNLVLYVPHVGHAEDMPWYHPKVRMLAFHHEWTAASTNPNPNPAQATGEGTVSVHYDLFPSEPIDQRLERTALQLLAKIHKHGRGQQIGYVKRVHHDQVLPQQRFQDTYARLKAKYAKSLMSNWVEETDPAKHVFEDLGIAAFLIELWSDMYNCEGIPSQVERTAEPTDSCEKPPFPGFVDIGCGNGLLVNLLIMEGYTGWGFDARRRKTWKTFTPEIQRRVSEMVLVPEVLQQGSSAVDESDSDVLKSRQFHNGLFRRGTFVISNHADELTPWTPLLAHLNDSPFIAIPCCSHNLAGAKWRAHPSKITKSKTVRQGGEMSSTRANAVDTIRSSQAAETGSLKQPAGSKNMPSAYASLCDYVSDLAREVGFVAEKEVLRIPSTRNICILGRTTTSPDTFLDQEKTTDEIGGECIDRKREQIRGILARELNAPLEEICKDWMKRAQQIAGKKSDGH